jgi:hypothetical protein
MESRSIPPVEYGFVCEDCKRGRKFGAARLTAERRATDHFMRFPDHKVHITKTDIVYTLTRKKTAVHQLGDEPPF